MSCNRLFFAFLMLNCRAKIVNRAAAEINNYMPLSKHHSLRLIHQLNLGTLTVY